MKEQRVYNKTVEWVEIEAWYVGLIEYGLNYQPMLDLIRFINTSNLSDRLFGYTSMHKLAA